MCLLLYTIQTIILEQSAAFKNFQVNKLKILAICALTPKEQIANTNTLTFDQRKGSGAFS
jgi:hypothetical protein